MENSNVKMANDLAWNIVQTKPMQEFRAFKHLSQQGYECFLPTLATEMQDAYRNEKKMNDALFPRYLFIRTSGLFTDWEAIRNSNGVSKFVSFQGFYVSLSDEWIAALMDVINARCRNGTSEFSSRSVEGSFFEYFGSVHQIMNGEMRARLLIESLCDSQESLTSYGSFLQSNAANLRIQIRGAGA